MTDRTDQNTNEDPHTSDTDVEIAGWMVTRIIDVMRDCPFDHQTPDPSDTLWARHTPQDYVKKHQYEHGALSTELLEAMATAAFLGGRLADGLFLSTALSLTDRYYLAPDDRQPWNTQGQCHR